MTNKLIYLDNCCFNRPYDDQDHLSIFLETQAKLALQDAVKNKKINIAWSFILDFENSENPDIAVKNEIFTWRIISSIMVDLNETIIATAKTLNNVGFSKKDSLHIASAIFGKVDFFITVDKGILKKRNSVKEIEIVTPVEMINYYEENIHEI